MKQSPDQTALNGGITELEIFSSYYSPALREKNKKHVNFYTVSQNFRRIIRLFRMFFGIGFKSVRNYCDRKYVQR